MIWATLAALAAAAFFAMASVFQHRGAGQVPIRGALSPRLLVDLARRPMWLIGNAGDVVGLCLQALALGLGAVAIVQPLMVTGLLLAGLLTAHFEHRRPGGAELGGAALCVAGLALFLVVAQPDPGTVTVAAGPALGWGLGGCTVAGACVLLGTRRPGPTRALLFAIATGILYGLSAALLKICTNALDDPLHLLVSWPLYALIVIGGAGYLLNQNAFQAGDLSAPLAAITILDPLVSIAVGASALSENISTSGIDPVFEGIGLAMMVYGVVVLARYAAGRPHAVERPAGGAVTVAGTRTASAAARRRRGPAAPDGR